MEEKNVHIEGFEPDESLLLRYIWEKVSVEERVWVDNWLQDDEEHENVLLQLANIYYAIHTQQRIEARDPLDAYGKVQKRISLPRRKIWLYHVYLAIACFVGILVLSTAIVLWIEKDVNIDTQMVTVQANAGMRTSFNLPDGTIAYLNSGSVLSYPLSYNKKERRVELTGEAYFKVVHNSEQPFVVSVANDKMRVKVLGTEFNLQSYKEETVVRTTLVSGSVNIEMVKKGSIVSRTKLKPSEKAVYDIISGIMSVSTVNTEFDTAWKDGRLIFKDMLLPEVLNKLAYFYNVKFEVKDTAINSYRFTGTFDNKQLSQVLDYLKISSRIKYTINHIKSDDSLRVQYSTVVLEME